MITFASYFGGGEGGVGGGGGGDPQLATSNWRMHQVPTSGHNGHAQSLQFVRLVKNFPAILYDWRL